MKKQFLTIATVLSIAFVTMATQNNNTILMEQQQEKEIVIDGVGITKTIEAKGNETIRIEGTNNKITITGACNTIKIEGVDNVVTVDDVKSVSIEGTGNKINYKKTSATDGKIITATAGVNNKITKI